MAEVVVEHPNRDKPSSRAAKAAVTLLLLVSAALIALITVGGWSVLQGAQPVAFGYVVLYLVLAYYVSRWNRGVLPVAAALAVLLAVIAAVAGPAWFERDKAGFNDPALDPALLGLLTVVLVPVQLLLVLFAMRAFSQKWNVEVEVRRGGSPSGPGVSGGGPEPAGASSP
ncbi:MAG: hypothetical protein ACRDN8_12425 [Thermoleophilaceae bacterium]